jgi:hypothetical protein
LRQPLSVHKSSIFLFNGSGFFAKCSLALSFPKRSVYLRQELRNRNGCLLINLNTADEQQADRHPVLPVKTMPSIHLLMAGLLCSSTVYFIGTSIARQAFARPLPGHSMDRK